MSRIHNAALLLAAVVTAAGCAAPVKPEGASIARNQLIALKTDATLAPQVPAALADAELAMQAAELPTRDLVAGTHAVHVAQRKIDIARADAERRNAEDALKVLKQERELIVLDGQSRELEIARAQAEAAATAAFAQQQGALLAQQQAHSERAMNTALRQQLQELQAETTDRGMVITLGDVLFATAQSDLAAGAADRLDKLAAFMSLHTDRTLLIEGHTDAQGSDENNRLLSAKRAEAVKAYLIIQGVDSARLTTAGRGKQVPVADNATPEGKQQNRRVEIIISNTLIAP